MRTIFVCLAAIGWYSALPSLQASAQADPEARLYAGDVAPPLKLKSLDGQSETDLAEFKGKRPVVLFFGSYT